MTLEKIKIYELYLLGLAQNLIGPRIMSWSWSKLSLNYR